MQIHERELPQLKEEVKGRRTVYGVGAFDLWHGGHVDYVRWLRELAGTDGLVVVQVRTDDRVAAQKGRDRPIIEQDERIYIVDDSQEVDVTFLGTEINLELKTSIHAATLFSPDVVAVGDGWRNEVELWRRHVPEAQLAVAPFPHRQSTSRIINKIRNS